MCPKSAVLQYNDLFSLENDTQKKEKNIADDEKIAGSQFAVKIDSISFMKISNLVIGSVCPFVFKYCVKMTNGYTEPKALKGNNRDAC